MSKLGAKVGVPLIPVITTLPGSYAHTTESQGRWEYAYDIWAAGTRSERRIGALHADGLAERLAAANLGDRIVTPWGRMSRMADTLYERGFLLERTPGQPHPAVTGETIAVPEAMLERDGHWTAVVGPWRHSVTASAMGTKSERRIGALQFDNIEIQGAKIGDFVETPWGRAHWRGPVRTDAAGDHEQGMLLRGTADRSLDDVVGDELIPGTMRREQRLESSYLASGFRVDYDAPVAHTVALILPADADHQTQMSGTLILDPNQCSLNSFGDRETCTRLASRRIEVNVVLQRLADPRHLGRSYFAVTGPGLSQLALIAHRGFERCYLTLEQQVVPLHAGDER
jgi:hypothetical protein